MYSQISANKRKTAFLIFGFFVIIAVLSAIASYIFDDYFIVVFAIVFAAIYALWSYYGADKLALSINNAVEIKKSDSPELWRIVENLSITNGLPMPKVYVINDPALNAFATGRDPNNSSVAITTGLLEKLDKKELEGVMAHELGHIQNYDIRVSLITFGLVAAVAIISDIILRTLIWGSLGKDRNNTSPYIIAVAVIALILAPIVATLIQLSISRKREYLADATGALSTRYPEGLAGALEKIKLHGSEMSKQNSSTAHLFFANPLKGGSFANLFSTHPPLDDRIARLRQMGEKA